MHRKSGRAKSNIGRRVSANPPTQAGRILKSQSRIAPLDLQRRDPHLQGGLSLLSSLTGVQMGRRRRNEIIVGVFHARVMWSGVHRDSGFLQVEWRSGIRSVLESSRPDLNDDM